MADDLGLNEPMDTPLYVTLEDCEKLIRYIGWNRYGPQSAAMAADALRRVFGDNVLIDLTGEDVRQPEPDQE